jgi:hypothetical protein
MPKQTKAGVSKAAAKANKETLLTEHNTSINNNNDEEDTESVHSQSTTNTNTNKRLRSSSSSNTTTTTNSPLKQMTNPNSNTSNKSKAKTSSSPSKLKATAAAAASSSSSSKEVKSYLKDLFATLKTYRCPTTSHCPSETFLRLPSSKSRANSHYYAQITRPIDMTQIEQKLNDNLYINVDDFDADFNLLITNAKTFYKTTTTPSSSSSSSSSLEYKHAQMLADIFEVEKKKRFDIVAMLSLMDNKHDGDDNDNEAEEMDEENEETTTPTKRSSSRSAATTTSTSSKVSPNAAAHSLVKSKLQTKLNATPSPSTATNLNTSASASADSAQLMASSFEEFFYTMASHKCPDTKRSLAIVFYMLPSNKV